VSNATGLQFSLLSHGAVKRIDCHGLMLNLFVGNELEGGPANLWLRRHAADGVQAVPLLGPQSPLRPLAGVPGYQARGVWQGLRVQLQLRLAASEPVWFWHVQFENGTSEMLTLDLVLVQDLGLAAYGTIRLNEYYVSHYIDHTPLTHDERGAMLAARQNLAVAGRHPWALMGSLRRGARRATDALQVLGLALRQDALPQGIAQGLPGPRLQHEHALSALQDEPLTLACGGRAAAGFFGTVQADHPAATQPADLAFADAALALPEAQPPPWMEFGAGSDGVGAQASAGGDVAPSRFASAPLLPTLELGEAELDTHFGPARRHAEYDDGAMLSFFHGAHTHVVLRAKELRVQRPHGHILHTGAALAPDESALTSTVWMGGVFHSMVTQGHVGINRFLSTVRGWLGQFRSHGQRIFIRQGDDWALLGLPSAFEMAPGSCRWLYRHAGGLIEVTSRAHDAPHALSLRLRVLQGAPLRLCVTHHLALDGDDGCTAAPLSWRGDARGVRVGVPPGSELAVRFPQGAFAIDAEPGTHFEQVGGDECLYADGRSRGQPWLCIVSAEVSHFALRLRGDLMPVAVTAEPPVAALPLPRWRLPSTSALAPAARQLADIAPWYLHNALVHFLAPRGLEQFSGGGWGTRDVCQGPLEMLLALDRPEPVRELLRRVFAAQDAGGDWPQWFMFFDRERHLRAADAHGDIVFWPLLGLARYLLASGDAAFLHEPLPFHGAKGAAAESGTLWQHVERALAVIAARRIAGTQLAAYGHGDWNDSLQPADPTLRERLCSAWTVTLHHQTLRTLARALQGTAQARDLQAQADAVRADFQALLMPGGVVTGYALFPDGQAPQMLLHPQDQRTGVHYSLLPMMHAILDDMLSPAQAAAHLQIIEAHLSGPDGARLFDRSLPYRGGPQALFQRAESSAFFGREIGVMYMHAHLRYAEMLAHLGRADAFFDALCKAHPLGLRQRVASASLRQANCYFSSSDAAFADRYEALREYARVAAGTVALDGGWRVYSSGPGIAIGLVVNGFLGVRREAATLVLDPVMPSALDGLCATLPLAGHEVELCYRLGPAGCGPTRLVLNGRPLPFTRGPNPYRVGAAQVAMEALRAGLVDGDNTLVVNTG
jgi:cellobiose phosphorylase